jgi:hypothetical protein
MEAGEQRACLGVAQAPSSRPPNALAADGLLHRRQSDRGPAARQLKKQRSLRRFLILADAVLSDVFEIAIPVRIPHKPDQGPAIGGESDGWASGGSESG